MRWLVSILIVSTILVGLFVSAAPVSPAPAPALTPTRAVLLPLIAKPQAPAMTATIPAITATPTRTPTATAVPVVLLPNGNFELGKTIWQPQDQADIAIINTSASPVVPRSGSWMARLVASQDSATGTALDAVDVVVPADKPYLSYWTWIRSTEPVCGDDLGGVGVSGVGSVDSFDLCVATQTDAWANRIVDLSAYAGHTVTIEILAGTFDTNQPDSTLFVDDVGWRVAP